MQTGLPLTILKQNEHVTVSIDLCKQTQGYFSNLSVLWVYRHAKE